MAMRADELRRQMLALSEEDRADLAAELLASLGDPNDDVTSVRADWDAEMLRRAEALEAGEVETESWDSVKQRLLSKRSG